MKRFSIFLMSVLLSLTSFAQETGCHLDFEGIPVTGTLNEFLTISESKGYKLLERNEQSMLLSGLYRGKLCRVLVERLPDQDKVWGLTVLLPSRDDWQGLVFDYEERRCEMHETFGEPVHVTEWFNVMNPPTTDRQKYLAVEKGMCSYKSVYENALGQVDVVIWSDEVNGCYVLVSYIDNFNSHLQE